MASSCVRGDSGWGLGKIYFSSGQALEWAAQGSGCVTIPEGVQEHLDVVQRDMVH